MPDPAPALPPPGHEDHSAPGTVDEVRSEWEGSVRPSLKGIVRALFTPVDVVGVDGATVTMAAPNDTHRGKCDEHRRAVESAWATVAGRTVSVRVGVGPSAADGPAADADTDAGPEAIDLDDLTDAGPGPTALDRLAQAFPGAEVIEGR